MRRMRSTIGPLLKTSFHVDSQWRTKITWTLSVRVLEMRSGSGIALIFPLVFAVSFESSECAIALRGSDCQKTFPSSHPLSDSQHR